MSHPMASTKRMEGCWTASWYRVLFARNQSRLLFRASSRKKPKRSGVKNAQLKAACRSARAARIFVAANYPSVVASNLPTQRESNAHGICLGRRWVRFEHYHQGDFQSYFGGRAVART